MNYIKIFEELLHVDTSDKLIAALKKNNLWDDDKLWRYYDIFIVFMCYVLSY